MTNNDKCNWKCLDSHCPHLPQQVDNPQPQSEWEKEFDEKLTYGVVYSASSDLSGGKGREMRFTSPEPVKAFIRSLLLSDRTSIIEKLEELDLDHDEAEKCRLNGEPTITIKLSAISLLKDNK